MTRRPGSSAVAGRHTGVELDLDRQMSAYELGEGQREVVDLVESTAVDRVASEERAEDQLAKLEKIGMTAGNFICDIKNDNKMVLKGIQILTD